MRQIVLLCDGTNNNLTGAQNDTHVVRLAELLTCFPDPDRLVRYDPGVGNPGQIPGAAPWESVRRGYGRIDGLAFARGVFDDIAEGYLFLMRHWRDPEDQIWLFGFSRGGFAARSIAGLVSRFGILQPHMESMVPSLLRLSTGATSPKKEAIAKQIRRISALAPERHPHIHFVGTWDPVASIGSRVIRPHLTAPSSLLDKRIVHVRQALALDEHRAKFAPMIVAENNGPTRLEGDRVGSLVQLWFRGAHCDVGGGYEASESMLSRAPFAWMLSEAMQCGLRVEGKGLPTANEELALQLALRADAKANNDSSNGWAVASEPLVHSELFRSPLWALTKLAVRNTNVTRVEEEEEVSIRPEEHSSVSGAGQVARFPRNAVWRESAINLRWWVHLALIALWSLALGQLATEDGGNSGTAYTSLVAMYYDAGHYMESYARLKLWQLTAVFSTNGSWVVTRQSFLAPVWALVWELGLIFSYASVLAPLVARAFASAAQFNRVGSRAPPLLNAFGRALPRMVFSHVGANLFAVLTIGLAHAELFAVAGVGRVLMAACMVSTLIGFAGVVALLVGWRILVWWRMLRPRPEL